jgi:hypothetical protein
MVDPLTKEIYSYNLKTNEIIDEKNPPQKIIEKIEAEIAELNFLMDEVTSDWWFGSEKAIQFRRRRLPNSFLKKCIENPMYFSEAPLSEAFSDTTNIKLVVNCKKYHSDKNIIKEIN